jgi:hypothetical protein
MRRLFGVLALAGALVACGSGSDGNDAKAVTTTTEAGATTTTSTTAPPGPKDARASELVAGPSSPAFPDGKDGLDTLSLGPAHDLNQTSLPIVLRNNTKDTIYNVTLTGGARQNGQQITTITGTQLVPQRVEPGEIVFGYVTFAKPLPAGSEMDATARAVTADSGSTHALAVLEAKPAQGPDRITGRITNPGDKDVAQGDVVVACFGADGTPLYSTLGHTGAVAAGDDVSFTVELKAKPAEVDCSRFLVGASG